MRAGGLCSTCYTKRQRAAGGPERRKVADLRPHPLNAGIYGDGPDAALIDSVKRNGVLNAIVINHDNIILGGHRRWRAAQIAGREDVPVKVEDIPADLAALRLVEDNIARAKTNEQIGREADLLWGLHQRQAGRPAKAEIPAPVPEFPPGETRQVVADLIGVTGNTAQHARDVVRHIDALEALDDHDSARALRDELSRSIKGAWELMRSWQRPNMPPAAPDLPEPPAAEPAPQQPESKEDADEVFGPDGAWPAAPVAREDVDDLAGPDAERDDADATPGELADGLNELSQQIGDTAGRDEEAAAARIRLDPFGIPLHLQPGAREAFATAEQMAELAEAFRNAGRAMSRLAKQGGAEALRLRMRAVTGKGDALSYRSVDADNAVLALTQCMPACCRCPECHARGLTANAPDCGLCRGRPYVTAHQITGVERAKVDAVKADLGVPGQEAA